MLSERKTEREGGKGGRRCMKLKGIVAVRIMFHESKGNRVRRMHCTWVGKEKEYNRDLRVNAKRKQSTGVM